MSEATASLLEQYLFHMRHDHHMWEIPWRDLDGLRRYHRNIHRRAEEEDQMAVAEHTRERVIAGQEVARILRVSAKTVSRWAREGKLPHSVTFGGHRRYVESEIRALASDFVRKGRP